MKNQAIIFFTRIPTMGKTKTRLEPFLGKELCVKLQTAFIEDIYNNIKDMGTDIIVNYSDHGDREVLERIIQDDDVCFLRQEGKDLGEKMHHAMAFALKNYKKAVLIGSDLPLLNNRDIEAAFQILEDKDIAISPTYDGGYYLIGMKQANQEIFHIKYSTGSVFLETIAKINRIGKSYGEGNIQLDVDDAADFLRLCQILKEAETIPCPRTRALVQQIMENRNKNESD